MRICNSWRDITLCERSIVFVAATLPPFRISLYATRHVMK